MIRCALQGAPDQNTAAIILTRTIVEWNAHNNVFYLSMYGCSMGGVFLLVSMIPIKHVIDLDFTDQEDERQGLL